MADQTISVSLSRKVNLGNYESADVFVSLSGLTEGMTEADMEPLLEVGAVAYGVLRKALAAEVTKAKAITKSVA